MLYIRRIVGESMLPALQPHAIIVAINYRQPRVGDVVVARHKNRELVKRVFAIVEDGLDIRGDNADKSTDSRHFGLLKWGDMKGIVVWSRY